MGIAVVVWVVGVGAYWWWWRGKVVRTEASYQKEVKGLSADQEVGTGAYGLKYKARLVGKLLESRYEYGRSFQKVASLATAGMKIKESRMAKDGLFEVGLEVSDSESMARLEDRIKEINEGRSDNFKGVEFRSVGVRNGAWTVTAEVELK